MSMAAMQLTGRSDFKCNKSSSSYALTADDLVIPQHKLHVPEKHHTTLGYVEDGTVHEDDAEMFLDVDLDLYCLDMHLPGSPRTLDSWQQCTAATASSDLYMQGFNSKRSRACSGSSSGSDDEVTIRSPSAATAGAAAVAVASPGDVWFNATSEETCMQQQPPVQGIVNSGSSAAARHAAGSSSAFAVVPSDFEPPGNHLAISGTCAAGSERQQRPGSPTLRCSSLSSCNSAGTAAAITAAAAAAASPSAGRGMVCANASASAATAAAAVSSAAASVAATVTSAALAAASSSRHVIVGSSTQIQQPQQQVAAAAATGQPADVSSHQGVLIPVCAPMPQFPQQQQQQQRPVKLFGPFTLAGWCDATLQNAPAPAITNPDRQQQQLLLPLPVQQDTQQASAAGGPIAALLPAAAAAAVSSNGPSVQATAHAQLVNPMSAVATCVNAPHLAIQAAYQTGYSEGLEYCQQQFKRQQQRAMQQQLKKGSTAAAAASSRALKRQRSDNSSCETGCVKTSSAQKHDAWDATQQLVTVAAAAVCAPPPTTHAAAAAAAAAAASGPPGPSSLMSSLLASDLKSAELQLRNMSDKELLMLAAQAVTMKIPAAVAPS